MSAKNPPSPITRQRDIDALQIAASWPGAAQRTVVVLATRLVGSRRDFEGYRFFQQQADANPGAALPLALAGFFQARLGEDVASATAKLDKAAEIEPGLPNYLRGLAFAALPADPERARQAAVDLEFVLAIRELFPAGLIRGVRLGLASVYAVLGRDDEAALALDQSGLAAFGQDTHMLFSAFSASPDTGFRFGPPTVTEPAPGIKVANGYDFSDLAFVFTETGVVAIDAGASVACARSAIAAVDLPAGQSITHVILTHAHWDHIGGLDALNSPGPSQSAPEVIAQTGFPAELALQRGSSTVSSRYFPITRRDLDYDVRPNRLIDAPTSLAIGGVDFALIPVSGGETADGLMIHLPASDVVFVGDVMMPYLGAPQFPEGSPQGLIETIGIIRALKPRVLIHGHTPLTETFTAEALPGLEAALRELLANVTADIHRGRELGEMLDSNHLPEVLRDHPDAVLPYVVIRDGFISRLYHQLTGYWKPSGEGVEVFSLNERAAALDLLAGGRSDAFVQAGTSLLERGDYALGLDVVDAGVRSHPESTALVALRQTLLHRLMEGNQQLNPFKFLTYADQADACIPPVA